MDHDYLLASDLHHHAVSEPKNAGRFLRRGLELDRLLGFLHAGCKDLAPFDHDDFLNNGLDLFHQAA
jgi:hypothetical protein